MENQALEAQKGASRHRNTVVLHGFILTREQGKLSQTDFVEELEERGCTISLKTYQKCVKGEPVDRMTAQKLADALDLSLEELVKTAPLATDTAAYLRAIENECRYIVPKGLKVGDVTKLPIEEAYIHLTVKGGGGVGAGEDGFPGREKPNPVDLEDLIERERLVVVTGLPGSGKSTFVQRVAYISCRSGKWFPARIELAKFEKFVRSEMGDDSGTRGVSADWLPKYLEVPERGHGLDAAYFRKQFHGRNAIVLCDGLDEVQNPYQRARVAKWLMGAAKSYPGTRFVVTTRPHSYQGDSMLAGFHVVSISELDEEAKSLFLGQWAAVAHPGEPAKAVEFQRSLLEALAKPGAEAANRLASNPMTLAAIAVIYHHKNQRLPEDRAELYDLILEWLLTSREVPVGEQAGSVRIVTGGERRKNFEVIALGMQTSPEGRLKQLGKETAARLIAEHQVSDWDDDEAKVKSLPSLVQDALLFLEGEFSLSGIVVEKGDLLEFAHLTYAEYLAAAAITNLSEIEMLNILSQEERWQLSEWREVFLLVPAILKNRTSAIKAIVEAVLARAESPAAMAETKAKAVALLGAMLDPLNTRYRYPNQTRYRRLLEEVRDRLAELTPKLRVDAAEVIDHARVERLNPDRWIKIAGGEFTMGASKRKGHGYDENALASEKVRKGVKVGACEIARYPVTVCEFGLFVADIENGYRTPRHWAEGQFPGDENAPPDWARQAEHPNRPVVNVSWYAASAYCKWLSDQMGRPYRLPKEEEWEFAARGGPDGRKYPWGEAAPDSERANYDDTGIGAPSPVGLFPKGATPEGIDDLAGNVFEWTDSWYDEETKKTRVLRGGCWLFNSRNLRAAVRNYFVPDLRNYFVGFRVVREA